MGALITNDSPTLIWLVVLVVSVASVANDVMWAVTLEERRLTIGGFRKKAISKTSIESAYVWRDSGVGSTDDQLASLRLADGSEHRIWGSAMAATHEMWAERSNQWLDA